MTGSQHDVLAFERIFADTQDLEDLTYAARRILAMSATLFFRRGVEGTSIRDITSACGLTPGALYKHFASKDDLLYALVRHGHQRLDDRLTESQAAAGDDPVPRLAAFVRAYVSGHLESPELAQLVRRDYAYLSADRRDEIVRRRRQLRQRVARLLDDGSRAGAFHLIDSADATTRTAVMVLDMCSRVSEWYHPNRGGTPRETLAEHYVQAALRLAGARRD